MGKITAKKLRQVADRLEQMTLDDFMDLRTGDLDIEPPSEAMANLERLILSQKPCPPEFLDYMNEHMEELFA
jgi:hypothetical protein